MEILIQPVGKVENEVLLMLEKSLKEIFRVECHISKDIMEIPEKSYNPSRNQYHSTEILSLMMNTMKIDSNHVGKSSICHSKKQSFLHVIGITEVDLYVPGLNFVFGEAECPGNFAIISLHRLKSLNRELYLKRVLKNSRNFLNHKNQRFLPVLIEAVHELGHTFGLPHCENHLCVMHFSNSIVETDIKGPKFCRDCLKRLKIA